MELLKYLVIIFVICGFVESLRIDCEIYVHQGRKYCKVNELKVLENDIAVTEVLASYTTETKSNDDFREFYIPNNVETERVPTKICDFLQNLERVDIYGRSINQITREVFTNCKKVTYVKISFTSLTTIPEDLFMDLIELENLYLSENKLVSLPADLLVKNTKIKELSARDNRLSTIDTELPSTLTLIDFSENVCIDKKFPNDIADFNLFIREVASNCESEMKKTNHSKLIAIEKTLSDEEENANLKSSLESLKISMTEKDTNIRKLSQKNDEIQSSLANCNVGNKLIQENLTTIVASHQQMIEKVDTSHRSKVIELNKFLSEMEEEISNLKHNKETCQREKDALATNVTQLISTNENLQNEIEELKTDISANEMDKSAEMLRLLSENQSLKLNYENLLKTLADLTKSN